MTNDTTTTDGDDPLSNYTTPLATTDPEGDTADLATLEDHLADAAVVGLGEATHGTREFFRLKDRLIRHLVRDHGCRTVAFEANLPEATAIDDYVVHGEGDPAAALAAVYFWTWHTEAVRDLLAWLRAFNADRPVDDCVRFYGVDAQYTQGAVDALREFLATADPDFLDTVADDLAAIGDGGAATGQDGSLDDQIATADERLPALRERFDERREAYVDATTERRVRVAERCLRVAEQAIEYKRATRERQDGDDAAGATERVLRVRDRAMAENLAWVRDQVDGPVALWAHDAHLNRVEQSSRRTGATAPSLGHHLAEEHGSDYYALGFAFGRGGFQAIDTASEDGGLCEHVLDAPRPETIEERLADLGHEQCFLECRGAAEDDRLAASLAAPQRHFSTGAVYDETDPEDFVTTYRYAEAFDGLVYVDETTRARPLGGGDG